MTGSELRTARESRRLSQEELATLLGISRNTVIRDEQSDDVPTVRRLAYGAVLEMVPVHPLGAS